MNKSIWEKLQSIDRRILYGALLVVIALPLLIPAFVIPPVPDQQTKDAYAVVEHFGTQPGPKMAMIDGWWSASSRGEQQYQTEAIIEHLMRLDIPFAIISGDPQNTTLTEDIAQQTALKYHRHYGVDWIDWGYQVAYTQVLKAMVGDIPGTLKEDGVEHRPLTSFPIMKNVHSFADVGLIFEITPSSSLDTLLSFVESKFHMPIIYAPTAVMAPEAFPFLDSHQIAGLILGVKGASDYEQLLNVKGDAVKIGTSMSMVYLLIIFLIILGNVGYHGARLSARREEGEQ